MDLWDLARSSTTENQKDSKDIQYKTTRVIQDNKNSLRDLARSSTADTKNYSIINHYITNGSVGSSQI